MKVGYLRNYATGVAVADVDGDGVLKVKLLDVLPHITGEVTDETEQIEIKKLVIPDGEKSQLLNVGDFVPAFWLNRNPNRRTPPDTMKGERVDVYKLGDKEVYYWETRDVDTHLRTTERILFYISNTNRDDRATKELTPENCYMIEVSTLTEGKLLKITTNKNDGEPFAHEIMLDTINGVFKINDDDGLHIMSDSINSFIEMINKEKTQLRMEKEDILQKCTGNYTLEVGGDFVTKIGKTRTVEVGKATTYKYGGDVTITAPNYSVTTTFSFSGDITHSGNQKTSGKIEAAEVKAGKGDMGKIKAGKVDAGKVSAPQC